MIIRKAERSFMYPFARKRDITLSQKGDELTVRVGDYKRNIFLPRKLMGKEAGGARLDGSARSITLE